jgi:biopolymer transport protein ExbB/TolQ
MTEPSLHPIEIFQQAGPVVKGVMILLAVLSAWCWGIVLQCSWSLWRLRAALSRARKGITSKVMEVIHAAATEESSIILPDESGDARRRRIINRMHRAAQERVEQEQGGLSNLAVISSVAPFVGLLGTVWGIMTSFIGIAAMQDTSLAVVAPGIAEALAATAIGLAAAIPAAFFYNRFAASFTRIGRALGRLIEDHGARSLQSLPTEAAAPALEETR